MMESRWWANFRKAASSCGIGWRKIRRIAWCVVPVLAGICAAGGCGTIPNAIALIRSSRYYRKPPQFLGAQGPLSAAQGRAIVAKLERETGSSDILSRQLAFEQAISGTPLIAGNQVALLNNASAAYPAMLRAIQSAQVNINLETYIFADDTVGRRFADTLIAKQRHGIQVNVIYDGFGSEGTPSAFFDSMRAVGIHVLEFNPIAPWHTRVRWSPDHRDHRKLLVVDGRVAFTGGMNISNAYSPIRRAAEEKLSVLESGSRDTDVEIEGPAVAAFQRCFLTTWRTQNGTPLDARQYFTIPLTRGTDIVRVLASVPEQFSLIYVTLISAINNAQTNIFISDAYFAPDAQMLDALEAAARRGVDVRLLVPGRTNEPLIGPAARSHYSELMSAGVKVYQWRGRMLHAKTATIDGVWSTVGSSNLDWWSIARDNELNAVIINAGFADRMNLTFHDDLENSDQIVVQQWRRRPLMERLDEAIAGELQRLL